MFFVRIAIVVAVSALPGILVAQTCIPSVDITCECDPSVDPSCGCDPSDPTCGGTICDPTTDSTCGLGCDPTTDPACLDSVTAELRKICEPGKGAGWAFCMYECYHHYDSATAACDSIAWTGFKAYCYRQALKEMNTCANICYIGCNS